MIKQLELKNFRSHRDTILDFHPGINVVCGLSRSGKSNLYRALQWLLYFRPAGDRIISRFADEKEETKVSLDNVSLTKKGSKAFYQIGDDQLSGFGTTVPKEVIEALNINEINLQNQLNEYFLITESPGEVARTINDIIKIDKADSYISSITTKINSTNHKIGLLEDQNKKAKDDIDKLVYLDDMKNDVHEWTNLNYELEVINKNIEFLDNQLLQLIESEKEEKFLINVITSISINICNLEEFLLEFKEIDSKIDLLNEALDYEDLIDQKVIDDLIKEIGNCFQLLNKQLDIDFNVNQLEKIIIDYQSNEVNTIGFNNFIENKKLIINETIEQYIEVLNKEKTCPVCFGMIDRAVIKQVKNKLKENFE